MAARNHLPEPLALEVFLAMLRSRGFAAGTAEHVRVARVLAALPPGIDRAGLKQTLAAVLAKSRDQQAEFSRVFDEYFANISPAPAEAVPAKATQPPELLRVRAWRPLGLAIGGVLLAASLVWMAPLLVVPPSPPLPPAPPAGDAPRVPFWALTPPFAPVTGGVSAAGEIVAPFVAQRYEAPPWWVALYESQKLSLWTAAILLPLAVWGAFEWVRRRRKKLAIERMLGEPPPRIWPIRLRAEPFDPFPGGELRRVVARMSRREASERESLDARASAIATAESGGIAELRFVRGTRAAEYLVLIERRSARDHLAHFHHLLAERLRAGGLYVDILFFRSDPRICEDAAGNRHSLERLRATHAGHRMLLFSAGEALTDPYTGQGVEWLHVFDGWTHRALLTPVEPARWWMEEETLSQPFSLAPATLEGLVAAVEGFETAPLALSHWKGEEAGSLDARQMELVRACALFPELHWDLTMSLADRAGLARGDLAFEELLPVYRLAWFREGVIPEKERFELIAGLKPEREREFRAEIERVLETAEWPPEGSAAALERSWWIRLMAEARRGSGAGVKLEVERQRDGRLIQDAAVVTLLRGRTGFALPGRLREMLFDAGVPLFGWRPWLRAAAAGLMGLALCVAVASLGREASGWRAAHAPTGDSILARTQVNPVDGLTYVWIPPGEFLMGCSQGDTECDDDEKPAHPVRITKGFWMSESEVTQAAYQKVIGSNPSNFISADLPVEQVSWNEAAAYCKVVGGRLPTEAEWEYAARGGDPRARYGELKQIAWYDENSGNRTHPVKGLAPNRFGLYDMLGNVYEWTADWHGEYQPGAQVDPKGPATGTGRVLRGGSWVYVSQVSRASFRGWSVIENRIGSYGFRCARE